MSKYIDADRITWSEDVFGNKIAYATDINAMPDAPVAARSTATKVILFKEGSHKLYECSNCHTLVYDQYCPHCGAKLVGEERNY